MKNFTFSCIMLLILFFGCKNTDSKKAEKKIIPVEDFLTWKTLGEGKVSIEENSLIIEETEGSDGFFLMSPEFYKGDMKIDFKFKAMSESTVMIVLFSASDSPEKLSLTLPNADASNNEINSWRREMNHYNLTFNNDSHGYTPFFFKNVSRFS